MLPDTAVGDSGLARPRLSFLHNLVALSSGELTSKVIGFLVFAYLARVLGASAYGVLELAVSLSVFFALVTDFGLCAIGARQVARDPGTAGRLSAQIPVVRLGLATFGILAMGLIALAINNSADQKLLIWLFALSLVPVAWTQRWLFQGLERMVVVSSGQVIRSLVFTAGVVILIRGPGDLSMAGWAEIGATLAAALYFLAAQQIYIAPPRLSFHLASLRPLLSESLPLGLSQIVWTLGQYLPILLIALFHGSVQAAWFGAAHRIVFSLGTFSSIYHFNLFPALTRSLDDSPESFETLVGPSIRATAWGGSFVALVGMLLAVPICRIVFGGAFGNAAAPLAIMVWMFPVSLLYGHARSALIAGGKQRHLLIAQIAGVTTTLLLGLWLIPGKGALGGAIAMLASVIVVWAVTRFFAARLVAPIHDLASPLRPAAVALVVVGLTRALGISAWWSAALAAVTMLAGMSLMYRQVVTDIRRMVRRPGTISDGGDPER